MLSFLIMETGRPKNLMKFTLIKLMKPRYVMRADLANRDSSRRLKIGSG